MLATSRTGQHAQIHLSDARGKHEMSGFRSFHSFSFGNYQDPQRQPFGNLYVLNDDTLAGGSLLQLEAEEYTQVVLLPVVGGVACNDVFVRSGEWLVKDLAKGENISIHNPYNKESDLVNYLQLWFKTAAAQQQPLLVRPFDIENCRNRLISLGLPQHYPAIHLGKYKGRTKDMYQAQDPSSGLYVFVIQGAFEVEDRLLHARDGLALAGFPSLEFEALSNDAILFITETTQPNYQL